MKPLIKAISLLALAGFLFFSSCKKETQTFNPNIPSPPANTDYFGESMVTASVGGTIKDENNNAVANATVTIGSNNTTTDVNGVFLFRDISVNEKRTFVKVNKSGFFFGSRALYPSANAVSYVNIQLLSSNSVGSFSSVSGGIINASGVKLTFPANSIKVEGGGVYSGTVNVAAKFLDPESDDMSSQMPGDLMAVNSSNELKILETYGMAAVELTSPSGQKLNVADGKKVELSVPLSGAYLADAPASIPLWYFHESEGIWKEEGSAIKVGNEYVGEVSHFSFWNCDNPNPSTTISGTILCGTNPLANVWVSITNPSGRMLGAVRTNSTGGFSGFIPMNTALTIKVYSGTSCATSSWLGTVIYTANIGPYSSPVTLANIVACPSSGTGNGTLTVKLVDCAGAPISNGVLEVNIGWARYFLFPNATGDVVTNITYCANATIDIQGYDYANSKISAIQTVNTGATMNVGSLTVCGAIDEYITYNLDGTNYRIDKVPTNQVWEYSYTGATHISGYDGTTTTNNFTAKILGNSVGTYAMEPDSNYLVNSLNVLPASTSMNATFTTYGTTSGSYKIGTFTGTFTDQSSIAHTLNGTFRLKNL